MSLCTQRVFTIVTDITPGGEATIESTLRDHPFDFGSFRMLHFACFVILPAAKLDLPTSKLVLECNIDGSAEAFLDELARSPRLADIYSSCDGFDAAGARAYLRKHLKWPNLFHVGAPYRSVQSIQDDERVCEEYATTVKDVAALELGSALRRSPAGVAEWWNWELIKPWVAGGLLVLAVAALGWVSNVTLNTALEGFDRWLLIGFYASMFLISSFATAKLWVNSRPELRRPVALPFWIGFVALLIAWRLGRVHWRAAALTVSIGALLVWHLVREQAERWRNVRLAAMRVVESGSSPMAPFAHLAISRDLSGPSLGVRAGEWLKRWWPWLAILVTAWVIFRIAVPHPRILLTALTALGFLDALWVATLCGWPENGCLTGWHPKVIGYIAGVTLVSWLLVKFQFLTWGNNEGLKTGLFVIVTVIAFLGAWSVLLPAPPSAPNRVSRGDLDRLVVQEDRDVQNHMAAVVPLPPLRFRTLSIKFFLRVLSAFFFHSVLPDLYAGKLFGVPTVHFCQWVLIDDRNYLFFSNYDLSWNAYLDDFGATIASGLQKIWGQGINNPGFADVEEFKRYARKTMVPYQQWYQAYPGVTLRQIWSNARIRRRAAAGGEEQTVEVLRRCSSAPKTLPDFLHARLR